MDAGKTIRAFRKLQGIKQYQLARDLYISQQHLSQMERGDVRVSVEMMDEILNQLGYRLTVEKKGENI